MSRPYGAPGRSRTSGLSVVASVSEPCRSCSRSARSRHRRRLAATPLRRARRTIQSWSRPTPGADVTRVATPATTCGPAGPEGSGLVHVAVELVPLELQLVDRRLHHVADADEIGRASCRESVW